MKIWAIADLHLALSTPDKSMEVFGPLWNNYMERIKLAWQALVASDDLILLAGDITWAMKLAQAESDLAWIDQLPGHKLLIKGNHDYWWSSISKVRAIAPPSLHFLQNEAYHADGVAIAGSRLWDTKEINPGSSDEDERIFERELLRLETSLQKMDKSANLKICMTHYPPVGESLEQTRAAKLLEKYGIDIALFGHLHGNNPNVPLFGTARGIDYRLVSADYVGCRPVLISENRL